MKNKKQNELFDAFSEVEEKFSDEASSSSGAAASGAKKRVSPLKTAAIILTVALAVGLVTAGGFMIMPEIVDGVRTAGAGKGHGAAGNQQTTAPDNAAEVTGEQTEQGDVVTDLPETTYQPEQAPGFSRWDNGSFTSSSDERLNEILAKAPLPGEFSNGNYKVIVEACAFRVENAWNTATEVIRIFRYVSNGTSVRGVYFDALDGNGNVVDGKLLSGSAAVIARFTKAPDGRTVISLFAFTYKVAFSSETAPKEQTDCTCGVSYREYSLSNIDTLGSPCADGFVLYTNFAESFRLHPTLGKQSFATSLQKIADNLRKGLELDSVSSVLHPNETDEITEGVFVIADLISEGGGVFAPDEAYKPYYLFKSFSELTIEKLYEQYEKDVAWLNFPEKWPEGLPGANQTEQTEPAAQGAPVLAEGETLLDSRDYPTPGAWLWEDVHIRVSTVGKDGTYQNRIALVELVNASGAVLDSIRAEGWAMVCIGKTEELHSIVLYELKPNDDLSVVYFNCTRYVIGDPAGEKPRLIPVDGSKFNIKLDRGNGSTLNHFMNYAKKILEGLQDAYVACRLDQGGWNLYDAGTEPLRAEQIEFLTQIEVSELKYWF